MTVDKKAIERIVSEAMSLGKKALSEPEAKNVLKACGIPVPRFKVVKDVTGALEAAKEIGFPLALKVISPEIAHKSDIGGVAVGIKDGRDIEERWSQMVLGVAIENPAATIEGFLVEEMAPNGVEVITGVIKDEQFGPVAMFGTGGVSVELMKDVAFRLAPIDVHGAIEMMSEVKGYPLLRGFRGDRLRDIGAVAEVIVRLAEVVGEVEGIREIEINPLIVYGEGVMAVDARAALE